MTIQEIENAVNSGQKVHHINEHYTVIPDGFNDGKFLIKWDTGNGDSNCVGLLWEYNGSPYYKPEDFYIGE